MELRPGPPDGTRGGCQGKLDVTVSLDTRASDPVEYFAREGERVYRLSKVRPREKCSAFVTESAKMFGTLLVQRNNYDEYIVRGKNFFSKFYHTVNLF